MTDRDSDGGKRDRFDPRFDPAFQPGYDPRNDPTIAARSGSRFVTPPSAFSDPLYDSPPPAAPPASFLPPVPTAQSPRSGADSFGRDAFDADGPVAQVAGSAERTRADQRPGDQRYARDGTGADRSGAERAAERAAERVAVGERAAGEPEADTAATKRVNPFVVVLWIASAVFFFSGLLGLRALPGIELAASTSAGSSYFILQVYAYGYPLLIMLGLATAVGLLFLHAVRWSKRASAREPAD